MRVGADTGGTFTDLVADDGRVVKVPSTPDDPARAVGVGLSALSPGPVAVLAHGTTVATNTLLERSGASVALVTTEGFADVIEIARQVRPSLYDQHADRPAALVARALRFEAAERVTHDGTVLVPLDVATLPVVPASVDAVAICFLHADLHPHHERLAAAHYRALGFDVTASHEISPEFREYERTVTTVANAYVRPTCREYLGRLDALAQEPLVMTSAGGLVPVDHGALVPAALMVSGPAAGVQAAAALARACDLDAVVAFDMGGTSTDVCLVRNGVADPAPARTIAGLPIRLPSLDIHTIGAGGGSIAYLDPGGALAVGPRSAGAAPGPACYGHGGTLPTVTDADVLLGRIPADVEFPGIGALDLVAARSAFETTGIDPEGVVAVVDTLMAGAVRAVTVERGVDARACALVAFGGAGPLHACAVAELLGMATVVVPARAGVFSAVGLLGAPRRHDVVVSVGARELADVAAEATARATTLLPDATVEISYDCRYRGQRHELTVADPAEFPAAHARRNGHEIPGAVVEVVAVRARVDRPSPTALHGLPVVERVAVQGPAVVCEPDCTVWVPAGWSGEPGPTGALVLRRTEA